MMASFPGRVRARLTPKRPFPSVRGGGLLLPALLLGAAGADAFAGAVVEGEGETVANLAPIAVDDSASTRVDTPVVIPVMANDRDPDNGPAPLRFGQATTGASTDQVSQARAEPAYLTAGSAGGVIGPAGEGGPLGDIEVLDDSLYYFPPGGFIGTDRFRYYINDGAATASAVVTVTVGPVEPPPSYDLAPVAVDDSAEVLAGQTVRLRPLANDSDPNGNRLTLFTVDRPALGQASISADGSLVYVAPATLAAATEIVFGYTVSNGSGELGRARITLRLLPGAGNGGGAVTAAIVAPGGDVTVEQGDTVSFGAAAGAAGLSYLWDFGSGDPSGSTAATPGPVRFPEPGAVTVTLTVTDAAGVSSSDSVTVTVRPSAQLGGATLQAGGALERVLAPNRSSALEVVVSDAAGAPLGGVAVNWRLQRLDSDSTDGAAQLGGGERVISDAAGAAANLLQTGAVPGRYRVTASLAGNEAAAVTFLVRVGLGGITTADTPEAAAALALDSGCPQSGAAGSSAAQQDLRDRCAALFAASGDEAATLAALRALSAADVPAQGRTAERVSALQLRSVEERLRALRRQGPAFSLEGLTLNQDGRVLSGALLQRALQAVGGGAGDDAADPLGGGFSRLGGFATGTVNAGDRDTTRHDNGYDYDTLGVTAGVDYRLTDTLVLGIALGYADTDADLSADGELAADGWTLTGYASTYLNQHVYLDGVVSYGASDYDLERGIRYRLETDPLTTIDRRARSTTDGSQFGASLGVGYDHSFAGGTRLNVDGRLHYIDAEVDGFVERGADGLNLDVGDQHWRSLALTLGAEVSRPLSFGWGVLIPNLRLEYEREFKDDPETVAFRFAESLSDERFSFRVSEPDSGYFRVRGGLSALLGNGRSAFMAAEQVFGQDDGDDYSVSLGVQLEF